MKGTILSDRQAEFWLEHANYDSKWARNLLHNLVEFVPFIFEFDAASAGLYKMYESSGVIWPEDASWADADETLPLAEIRKVKVYQLALEIRAYAFYGLKLHSANEAYDLDGLLDTLETWYFPSEWGQDPEMERALRAAQGRKKLDAELGALSAEELAALANVERKSVLNMLAPARRDREGLEVDPDGCVTAASAKRWLMGRPGFRDSVWQLGESDFSGHQHVAANPIVEEPIFVPIAADGSWFSPASRTMTKANRSPRYYVANGEAEEAFDDYWSALAFLARASAPRWRYFDGIQRWRVKEATGWTRKARAEVEL